MPRFLASSVATRGLCSELLESVISEHELLTCEPVLRELRIKSRSHYRTWLDRERVQNLAELRCF